MVNGMRDFTLSLVYLCKGQCLVQMSHIRVCAKKFTGILGFVQKCNGPVDIWRIDIQEEIPENGFRISSVQGDFLQLSGPFNRPPEEIDGVFTPFPLQMICGQCNFK